MTSTQPVPLVVSTRADLADALRRRRELGSTVALVPTMGALHAGHEALLARASATADVVVVSVFVNPLQFGAGEDLDRYPRTLDADLDVVARAGGALVFAPTAAEMYDGGPPQVRVHAGPLGDVLEGAARPGHFDGVLTVVLKLLGLVRPDVVVFGAKDAQQLVLVRRMVHDLDVPVRVEAVPTVRDPDGLAVSSRNRFLATDDRARAGVLWRALRAGADAASHGPAAVRAAALHVLAGEPAFTLDYCELVDPLTLAAVAPGARDALLLVAGRLGSTRLIDGTTVTLPGGDA
jgi:pantoate--beta-alanine ligase